MAWQDLGVIFAVNNLAPWAVSHCYVPTAIALGDRIRVFAAFWDANKYGRLGFVDVCAQNPTKVLDFSLTPIMEDSQDGAFDCNGVTPLSVIVFNLQIRLYYAGWKQYNLENKRYTIFTGLAVSDLSNKKFFRYSKECILGPRHENDLLRTGCMVSYDDNIWHNWFASYEKSIIINNKTTPAYNLTLATSHDGIVWNDERVIFNMQENVIMGYGRSAIWKESNLYHGLIPVRNWNGRYSDILYSTSKDGVNWMPLSFKGMAFSTNNTCDKQTEVSFPTIIKQRNRYLMFYNGNDFGKDGLRLAIWN